MAKKTATATAPATETDDKAAAAKAAIEAYRAAQAKVEKAEAELSKLKQARSAAVELIHGSYGKGWLELDGKLVQARRNKVGYHLVEFAERSRPTPAAVL